MCCLSHWPWRQLGQGAVSCVLHTAVTVQLTPSVQGVHELVLGYPENRGWRTQSPRGSLVFPSSHCHASAHQPGCCQDCGVLWAFLSAGLRLSTTLWWGQSPVYNH